MSHSAAGTPLSPLDSESPGLQNKKRKIGSSSGRGVASLTPEQLAKKRANDREAQRAIRERTKATIESLEQKIRQLESQQPYQELQAVIRQKEAVQAENDEIRRRLASILSIIQPVVGAQSLTDLASAAQHNVQLTFGQQSNNIFQQHADQFMSNGQRQYQSNSPSLSSPQVSNYPQPYSGSEPDSAGENRVWTSSRDALNQQRDNLDHGLELNESGERLTFNFLLDGVNQKQTLVPNVPNNQIHTSGSMRPTYQTPNFPDQNQPVSTMLPKNCAPTCPLDSILLNFLQARQRESKNGNSIISPAYPSVISLLNPSTTNANMDPISQLMTDIISTFPHICNLPEQVAVLFNMFLYMRWQIYPTQENYERLPEFLVPRPSQLFTSHPAWIDHLPFPRMRDRVIQNHQDYPFENWFLPFTSGLCVNWNYEPVDCLLSTGEGEKTTINPVFERHIRRLENWSLGPQFLEAYPALADTCQIRDTRRAGMGIITSPFPHAGPHAQIPQPLSQTGRRES